MKLACSAGASPAKEGAKVPKLTLVQPEQLGCSCKGNRPAEAHRRGRFWNGERAAGPERASPTSRRNRSGRRTARRRHRRRRSFSPCSGQGDGEGRPISAPVAPPRRRIHRLRVARHPGVGTRRLAPSSRAVRQLAAQRGVCFRSHATRRKRRHRRVRPREAEVETVDGVGQIELAAAVRVAGGTAGWFDSAQEQPARTSPEGSPPRRASNRGRTWHAT